MPILQKMDRGLKVSAKLILDGLFPPQCPCCNDPVDSVGTLCATCWMNITFISDPVCACCGYPFEYDAGENVLCGNCIAYPPDFNRGLSVFQYDDHSRDMLLSFKHGDRTDRAVSFAIWMHNRGAALLTPETIIVPVPLHRSRLLRRRFNQSALLAKEIGKRASLPVCVNELVRKRSTPTQGGKSLKARFRNVKGAFEVRDQGRDMFTGKHILLIDDVYTTGATLNECARCLLQAGAQEVSFLTLSRVVRATNLSI